MDLVQWWYVRGWAWVASYFFAVKSKDVVNFFSMKDLLRTLFAPYRQTFAGKVNGGVGDKLRGFVDRSVSRVIGFIVRFALLIAGLVTLLLTTLFGVICTLLWPIVPVLPVLGLILAFVGLGNAV